MYHSVPLSLLLEYHNWEDHVPFSDPSATTVGSWSMFTVLCTFLGSAGGVAGALPGSAGAAGTAGTAGTAAGAGCGGVGLAGVTGEDSCDTWGSV